MTPKNRLRRAVLRTILATPEGRAHVLSLMIAAEEGDEAGVFDRLIERVESEGEKRAMRSHKLDEERHAGLYRACLERNGLREVRPIPESLLVVRAIAHAAGGAFADNDASLIVTREDVMHTFAILLAIETRGVEQFPRIGAEFRRLGDAATADTFDEVARDERGHVKSCASLGRRYASDDAAWEEAVASARMAEARAFETVGFATLVHAVRSGLLWRGLVARSKQILEMRVPRVA